MFGLFFQHLLGKLFLFSLPHHLFQGSGRLSTSRNIERLYLRLTCCLGFFVKILVVLFENFLVFPFYVLNPPVSLHFLPYFEEVVLVLAVRQSYATLCGEWDALRNFYRCLSVVLRIVCLELNHLLYRIEVPSSPGIGVVFVRVQTHVQIMGTTEGLFIRNVFLSFYQLGFKQLRAESLVKRGQADPCHAQLFNDLYYALV